MKRNFWDNHTAMIYNETLPDQSTKSGIRNNTKNLLQLQYITNAYLV